MENKVVSIARKVEEENPLAAFVEPIHGLRFELNVVLAAMAELPTEDIEGVYAHVIRARDELAQAVQALINDVEKEA